MKKTKPIKPRKQPKKGKPMGKKQYKVRNWKEYNQALVDRGKITFWITDQALDDWQEQTKTGKRGKPKLYSNVAIETAIMLQQVFRLPLRQVEGFLSSILTKMQSDRKAPDYSTLSVRGVTLDVAIRVRPITNEPLHIVIDSTGAKVYGEGEWKVRQHGWGKKPISSISSLARRRKGESEYEPEPKTNSYRFCHSTQTGWRRVTGFPTNSLEAADQPNLLWDD